MYLSAWASSPGSPCQLPEREVYLGTLAPCVGVNYEDGLAKSEERAYSSNPYLGMTVNHNNMITFVPKYVQMFITNN